MARPAAPSTATKEVVAIPTIDATEINNSIFKIHVTKLLIKGISVGSTLDLFIETFSTLLMPWIIHKPTSRVMMANANRGAYSMPSS